MGSEIETETKSDNMNNNEKALQISPGTKKMIQSLREIVNNNCTDTEIYSVLRDCDMDPNDAVQRLLSQDIFHQVKSKRERRKEMKETQESKTRCSNNGYRGVKVGAESNGGRPPSQIDLGKAVYMRENLPTAPSVTSSSLTYRLRSMNEQPSPLSADNGMQFVGTGIAIFSSDQTFGGSQAAWGGGPSGHVSMADIVKMGRPETRGLHTTETSHTHQDRDAQDSLLCCLKPSDDSSPSPQEMHRDLQCPDPANLSKTIDESGTTASQHDFDDEWPVMEQRTVVSTSPILNISTTPCMRMLPKQSQLFGDESKLPENCQSEDTQVSERNVAIKNLGSDVVESDSPSSRHENANHFGGGSYCNDGSFNDMISYNLLRCIDEPHEVLGRERGSCLPSANVSAPLNDEVTSTVVSLQQLSLGKEETKTAPLPVHNSAVLFPTDMPALAADCSHLSFGTYKSGVHTSISGPLASNALKSNLEEASAMLSGSSPVCLETRNSGYLGESQCSEQIGSSSDTNRYSEIQDTHQYQSLCSEQVGSRSDTYRLAANIRNHELPVSSQPELMKQNIHEVNGGPDHISPKSVPDSCFKNIQQSSSPWSVMISPHARNLPPLHRELQASSTPLPVDVLASVVQSARDSDCVYPSFTGTESLTSRYSDIISSACSSTIPMTEILNSGVLSLPNSHSSSLPAASLAAGHVFPQHQSRHSYSQPIPSFEELNNWTAYSTVPQTYPCIPSALQQQQAYQDSGVFHEPLASIKYNLQQSRGSVASRSRLPLFNANFSSYGGLGNPTNSSGSYLNDLSTVTNGSAVGYDDFLQAQYREGNNFTMLPQNASFPSWDYGHGSRTLSTIPDNGYYHMQGQGQPLSTYQQGQLLSQSYGALGCTNIFHSQRRIAQEEQQQNLGDSAFSSSQGPSKQLHQLWQHIY